MHTIQPVIVIYNIRCCESVTLKSMMNQGVRPVVVDNSTINLGNREYCKEHDADYVDMHGNAGLSKAYNRAIGYIKAKGGCDYILWLDDDTEVPEDYIKRLESAIETNPENKVYLPIVKSANTGYLSPNIMRNMHTYRINSLDEIGDNMISAINSGMMVNMDVYDSYRYDEKLFLDCIDHDFMTYVGQCKLPVYIMSEPALYQNFSGDESGSLKGKLARHRIYSADYRYFRKKHGCSSISTEAALSKRTLSILIHTLFDRRKKK